MPLETELAFYEKEKANLLQHHAGQFALIKGEQLIGSFTTFEEAFEAGVAQFGNEAFLVRQVVERDEPIQHPALELGLLYARP